ncbi:MAG: cell division protein FtsQ/DivIB [Pasteurellaceae bacterium]|nr:cell division protein FtsQ/DivIB [Pasteurellaceae bacterium]
MSVVFRKKPTSVIRTQLSKPQAPRNWWGYVKFGLFLLGLIFAYTLYANWSNWLSLLDKTPIKAYALTHKTQFTTNADIREALSKEPALKGYFGQDIQEIKQKFLEIPWVKKAVVRKIYPDRLSVTLVEHRPVAIWNNKRFLSDQGVIFELPKDRIDSSGFPILSGPDSEAKKVLDTWYKIQQDVASRQLVLKSVETDTRGSWTITLDNFIELRLGRGDWLPKIDRFVMIFPEIHIPDGKRLAYVDLRYEHGVAVGFISK